MESRITSQIRNSEYYFLSVLRQSSAMFILSRPVHGIHRTEQHTCTDRVGITIVRSDKETCSVYSNRA